MKVLIFYILIFYSSISYSKCGEPPLLAIDEPESLESVDPSSIKATMYDELLDGANVEAYKTYANNSGNFGLGGFDYEEVLFDKIENGKIRLCAHIAYGKLHETQRVGFSIAGINSSIKAKNFFEVCPATELDIRFPYYDHVCNFWPEDGEIIELSKKNKGKRGAHGNAFVYSTAKINHVNGSKLECLGFGTLFNSNFSGYFTEVVSGYICTDEDNYFTQDKVKKLAQSVGVYGTAEPTKDLRLSFHK
jgi:hypothetical protein